VAVAHQHDKQLPQMTVAAAAAALLLSSVSRTAPWCAQIILRVARVICGGCVHATLPLLRLSHLECISSRVVPVCRG
jgi:hypothetical protein